MLFKKRKTRCDQCLVFDLNELVECSGADADACDEKLRLWRQKSACYVNWQFDWLLEFATTTYDSTYKFDYVTVTESRNGHTTARGTHDQKS